ncbi:C39 family peptidase [Caldifermentibacillus hisashii]|uniref:C39 family peptidase n=1 Tax=Caldifermentibacillus hisashii TaxID=996558 RepID=UPI001C1146D5|nr:C39 family peptidase [Caldifermentibacillus hisashii]MBU5341966.1 C39 family peptidase [Caldifermentibacillus hisashii]MEC5273813.1 C39 family peptidase [Caldifermentibacillus hisashii]
MLLLLLLILLFVCQFFLRTKKEILLGFSLLLVVFSLFLINFVKDGKFEYIANAIGINNSQNQREEEVLNEFSIVKIKGSVIIDAPLIKQYPELPRGCEVTSLAMLLQFAGENVDKMTLANEVKKDPTPYSVSGGKVYFGNPHDGFVGDMYSLKNPGLGVFHEPIRELAEQYLPGRIIDMTGSDFEKLKIPLSAEQPVWVIINTVYQKISEDLFQTWETPSGAVKVTSKEHSVLVTGYDDQFIYFNDPLTGIKNKTAPIQDFKEAWVQMGSQAITILPFE